jgi:hypothetical protein
MNIIQEADICPCCNRPYDLQDAPTSPKKASSKDFEAFWLAYPKKTAKSYCKDIWMRKKLSIESVLPALKKSIASPDWQKDGGKFIPNPSTWLNQGRYEDEGMDFKALKTTKPTITSRLGVNEEEAFEWRCWVYPESMLVNPTWNTFPFSNWPKSIQQEYLNSITE